MSDERFRALATDPRYRLPSRKQAQTAVDARFKGLFTDDAFQRKANVDRYGRRVKSDSSAKDLKRRFRLKEAEDARKISSSDSEVSDETQSSEDQIRNAALEGFSGTSSSEEESTSEDESDDEEEKEIAADTAGNVGVEEVPVGEVTSWLAIVNLDWDYIRAVDIMAVAQSFAPSVGSIVGTAVYPSEFGLERMAKEELDGPPRAIFASSKRRRAQDLDGDGLSSSEEDDIEAEDKIRKRLVAEQGADGEEFDATELRRYQLERLRYYYAVITCDNTVTAKALYDNMDGREYLTTANFFDLRFVPADTTFDAEPRDECRRVPDGYKPNDFRTEALTHSKVKLTWDVEDATRKEVQKRAFSRAEMDENDLKAYIGSDSSDADSATSRKSSTVDRRMKKKDEAKSRMRALLGLSDATVKKRIGSADEPVGDMQITFSTGLSSRQDGDGVFENEPQDEASTRERYIRKERERKQRRKDKAKAMKQESKDSNDAANIDQSVNNPEDPFDDPFFNDPGVAAKTEKAAKRAEHKKRRDARNAVDQAAAARRAELDLLMAEDDNNQVRHFDMKEIEKAEKHARKKQRKRQDDGTNKDAAVDDFEIQTTDPRFSKLFDSHEYAIDPTNPRYKATRGMKDLLEAGRKKRRTNGDDFDSQAASSKKAKRQADDDHASASRDVSGLVARLKKRPSK